MADLESQVTMELNFGAVTAQILLGARKGQNLAAERLLTLSAAEVPNDPNGAGTLQATGAAVHAESEGEDAGVTYDTEYAVRWHEDQALVDSLGRKYAGDSNFQQGRKSHYLVDPALQNLDELRDIVATEAGRG